MTEGPEPADFLEWLDRTYRQKIQAMVRNKYPGFSQEDLDDVWAETLKCLFNQWPDGFDGGDGFDRLLKTIARRRACDHFRRIKKQRKLIKVKAEELEAKIRSEEQGGTGWWERLSPLERKELRVQVNEAFRLLSPDEWLVLAVYCEQYPKARSPRRLLALLNEEIPELRDKAWTPADVKRLLDQARTIVQNYLCRKGYQFDF